MTSFLQRPFPMTFVCLNRDLKHFMCIPIYFHHIHHYFVTVFSINLSGALVVQMAIRFSYGVRFMLRSAFR